MDVFRGADRILSESSPVLLFECEVRHCRHSIFDVFAHLEKRGTSIIKLAHIGTHPDIATTFSS
jgi:hypothetical protein